MRHDSVIIKSNAYGLVLILNPDIPFETLREDVGTKFAQAARFFRNAQMALTFRGRKLSGEEEVELVEAITQNARIQILCLVDEDKEEAEKYRQAINEAAAGSGGDYARIYRGTLRKGQVLESDSNLVILGDVNPGAVVTTTKSAVIFGCCMGSVTVGSGGDASCFVAAQTLLPSMVRIASTVSRSAITKREDNGQYPPAPKIMYLKDGRPVQEPLRAGLFDRLFSAGAQEEETETD